MRSRVLWGGALLSGFLSAASGAPTESKIPLAVDKQSVTFQSGDLKLVGFLFRPSGPGPFPALIWNHGSEQHPGITRQFDTVASIFVPAGFVVFAPVRRGHGDSEGRYIVDIIKDAQRNLGDQEANHWAVRLLETEQLADQMAGLGYLKTLKFVDRERVVVAGCSYGGIETLLGAEQRGAYRAAIAISPAALSWEHNGELRKRLVGGVANIGIPVLLLQPAKDASLEPVRVLGDEFERLGKSFTGKVYPPTGPEAEQAHCFGGAAGMHVWASDAVEFARKAVLPSVR